MDLLFKNPTYFFETYFSFSPIDFFVAFLCCCAILSLLCVKRFHSKTGRIVFIVISSLYLAALIGVTLLNSNRVEMQSLNMNPINNINELFGENSVHQLRGCLSNILFFVPLGILGAINFRKHKIILTVVTGLTVSVILEALQYVLHRGCAESMDVICNTFGALLGATVTVFILYIFNRNHKAKEH